jgi:hypothetical protein
VFQSCTYKESNTTISWFTQPREKIEGTPSELRQGLFTSSPGTPSPDSKPCSAFPDPEEPIPQVAVKSAHPRSVRILRASNSTKSTSLGQSKTRIGADPFAFGQDSFKADSSGTVLPKISNLGNTSQPLDGNLNSEEKKDDSFQPVRWTGSSLGRLGRRHETLAAATPLTSVSAAPPPEHASGTTREGEQGWWRRGCGLSCVVSASKKKRGGVNKGESRRRQGLPRQCRGPSAASSPRTATG